MYISTYLPLSLSPYICIYIYIYIFLSEPQALAFEGSIDGRKGPATDAAAASSICPNCCRTSFLFSFAWDFVVLFIHSISFA